MGDRYFILSILFHILLPIAKVAESFYTNLCFYTHNLIAIARHQDPHSLARALFILQLADILTAETLAVVATHARPIDSARALLRLQLADIFNPESLDVVARHQHPNELEEALSILQGINILNFNNLSAVARHQHPLTMARSLFRLQLASVLPTETMTVDATHAHFDDSERGMINDELRQIATYDESSMAALTPNQKAQVKDLTEAYPIDDSVTVIHDLKEFLAQRYLAASIDIEINSEKKKLPLSWADFEALHLDDVSKTSALQAYYKDINHTAYRYFLDPNLEPNSEPNSWMSTDAKHVNGNPRDGTGYAAIQQHYALIALLFTAAKDQKSTPVDPMQTVEDRVAFFVNELAMLNRAHNWDESGWEIPGNGEYPVEADDLEGDKPSCYGGVERRLFFALQGHILFSPLTKEHIQRDCNHHLKKYFKDKIELCSDLQSLCVAFNKVLIPKECNATETALLKSFDVTKEQKDLIIDYLVRSYKEKLDLNCDQFGVRTFKGYAEEFLLGQPAQSAYSKHGALFYESIRAVCEERGQDFEQLNEENAQPAGEDMQPPKALLITQFNTAASAAEPEASIAQQLCCINTQKRR